MTVDSATTGQTAQEMLRAEVALIDDYLEFVNTPGTRIVDDEYRAHKARFGDYHALLPTRRVVDELVVREPTDLRAVRLHLLALADRLDGILPEPATR